MNVRAIVAVSVVVAGCAHPGLGPSRTADGEWRGTLTTPGGELALVVRLTGHQGVLESPDQPGSEPTALTVTEAGPASLAFTAAALAGAFTGQWDDAQQGWAGVWSQSGYQLPLVLRAAKRLPTQSGLDGVWEGSVSREGRTFRMVLRIVTTNGETVAKFDAPDAGAANLGIADLVHEGGRVRFRVPAAGARFDGTLQPSGDRLQGDWFFPGRPTARVAFVRSAGPRASAPYRSQPVRFDNLTAKGVTLAGTLTVPDGAGPFPAAVLVTGSGAHDRDEAMAGQRPFAVLADQLARHRVVVLRCDDRGIGESTGDFAAATTTDFATDAAAAVTFLTTRPEVDHALIGLVGHSEGGLVAALASRQAPVAFLVVLGAPAVDPVELLLTQRREVGVLQGASAAQLRQGEPLMRQLFEAVTTGAPLSAVRALLTPSTLEVLGVPEARRELFAQDLSSPWMRQFLQLDPRAIFAAVTVPVLALNGSLDRQVAPAPNLAAIAAALVHHDVTVQALTGLNHLFQHAQTGAPTEYASLEPPFAPDAVNAIDAWLTPRLAR